MDGTTIATISGIAPKLIQEGDNLIVAQSRFLQEINHAKKTDMINPGGLYTPYTTAEAAGIFAVPEGGAIQAGTSPQYTLGNVGLRAMWKSISWTGAVERIRDQYLTKLRRENNDNKPESQLLQQATNFAVRDTMYSAFKMFARYENFMAIQGADNSAIGTVTEVTSTGANGTLKFNASTTNIGNRMLDIGAPVEFRSNPGGVLRNGTVAFATVNAQVLHDETGLVQFDTVGADIIVGDTVHFKNTYGQLPQGVPFYVDDAGTFQGVARTSAPAIFESVMIRHTNSPTVSPIHLRTQLSYMQGKVGYEQRLKVVIWMNKAQKFNFESYIYNNLIRRVEADKVRIADFAINEFEWDGNPLNIDIDVPPDSVDILNMASWDKVVQTPMKPYIYNTNDIVVNTIDATGAHLDAKQSTIFTEYNWRMGDPRSNSIQSGFAFDPRQIGTN